MKNIWIISFDGIALSGIITEALKLAAVLKEKDFHILLDIGYDIKTDKGNFGKPYAGLHRYFPRWVELARTADVHLLHAYNVDFLNYVFHAVNTSGQLKLKNPDLHKQIENISDVLSHSICDCWRRKNIDYIVVENGTLPENVIFTKALYKAIDTYGREFKLKKFVIWRDHDMMWSSETAIQKYGAAPYCNTIKPTASPFIRYVTLHDAAALKMRQWAGPDIDLTVLPNTYKFKDCKDAGFVRPFFKIKDTDIILTRSTRLIPQKRIDRDIHLVSHLRQRFSAQNKEVYLLILGDTEENKACTTELNLLADHLKITKNILFLGGLPFTLDKSNNEEFSVETIILASNVVSFLTSYDYDSYGNPIGEAISLSRCYLATRYEYYDTVYGSQGYLAPVMEITKEQDGLPDETFINDVYALLNAPERMQAYARFNFLTGQNHLSDRVLHKFCEFFQ